MFAAGAPDPSFSLDGKTTLNFPLGGVAIAQDVAVQVDGKTVVAGTVEFPVPSGESIKRFAVARFNVDGTLDKTFGPQKNGMVAIPVSNKNTDFGKAVAIQRDGRIVVVGTSFVARSLAFDGPEFGIARLMPDGTLDKSFDQDGKKTIQIKGDSYGDNVTIQPDGKIIVVGSDVNGGGIFSTPDFDFAIARLNPNGSLDGTFATGGKRIIGLGEDEFAEAVTVDTRLDPVTNASTGKIVIVGGRNDGSRQQYAIVHLNPNGGLDNTFDKDGSAVGTYPGYSRAFAHGVMIQPNGKMVMAGHAVDNTATDDTPITLTRFNLNGSIDTSFGAEKNGTAYIDFGGKDIGSDVVQSAFGGGLIVAGSSSNRFALAALSRDGVLDMRFGASGKVLTSFDVGGKIGHVGLAKTSDNKIVVAGGSSFKTARYQDFGPPFGGVINPDVLSGGVLTTGESSGGPVILLGTATTKPQVGGRIFSQVRI
jgi:uncharacterized delta-60 repeat protein